MPGAVFVNVSRGELSPSTALLAAALDVRPAQPAWGSTCYDHEPECWPSRSCAGSTPAMTPRHVAAIGRRPRATNVICTPHNAFNSTEAAPAQELALGAAD